MLKVALFLVALALVAAAVLHLSRADDESRSAPRTIRANATLTPAARRVATRFLAAVGRKDRAGARRLLARTAPCSRLVVLAGDAFRPKDASLSVVFNQPRHLYLQVIIDKRRVFTMGLKLQGADRWVVDYWDTHWSPQTAFCEAAQTSS